MIVRTRKQTALHVPLRYVLVIVIGAFAAILIWLYFQTLNVFVMDSLLLTTPNSATVSMELVLSNAVRVEETYYKCPVETEYVNNVPRSKDVISTSSFPTRIPRRVFQTSKSKCVVSTVAKVMKEWRFHGWEYYLFDDTDVDQFFQQHSQEFPLLDKVAKLCLVHGTLKADLWRYLVLWVYGGVYADLDTTTNKITPTVILQDSQEKDHDALFVVEQYHLLSQYFIAISPRHPLMRYAIEQGLENVLHNRDVNRINAAYTTGPHALHEGFRKFCRDGGQQQVMSARPGNKPVRAGIFQGTANRTVTVIGKAENQNEFVTRDFLSTGNRKVRAYRKMGMRHFLQDSRGNASGVSCKQLLSATR